MSERERERRPFGPERASSGPVRETRGAALAEFQALADRSDQATRLRELEQVAAGSGAVARLSQLQFIADANAAIREGGQRGVRRVAEAGVRGESSRYPHRAEIQAAFGRHRIDAAQGHLGPNARAAARVVRSVAYTMGPRVAFATTSPSLRVAAHEAAHVVQQAAGVRVAGGVGRIGDAHELQADRVAEGVVNGRNVERELDQIKDGASGSSSAFSVQMLGEGRAMRATVSAKIRRGNRRASVSSTKGHSFATQGFIVDHLWGSKPFYEPVLKELCRVNTSLTSVEDAWEWIKPRQMLFTSFAAEELKAGNCGQISDVLATKLVASTTDQWVYKAGFHGQSMDKKSYYDHGFVITSPQRLPTEVDGDDLRLPGDLHTRVSVDDVIVADVWDNNKLMGLDEFLLGRSYYTRQIPYIDVQILAEHEAVGPRSFAQLIPDSLQAVIKRSARAAFNNYKRTALDREGEPAYAEDVSSGQTKVELNRGLHDFAVDGRVHALHADASRLWDMTEGLKGRDRTAAFSSWARLSGARIDWRRARQAGAAFQYLAAKGGDYRTKAYSLVDLAAFPEPVSAKQLWKFIGREGLCDSSRAGSLARLVGGLSTVKLRALRGHLSKSNWSRFVTPHLTKKQTEDLAI